jgi:hypothetical protein
MELNPMLEEVWRVKNEWGPGRKVIALIACSSTLVLGRPTVKTSAVCKSRCA